MKTNIDYIFRVTRYCFAYILPAIFFVACGASGKNKIDIVTAKTRSIKTELIFNATLFPFNSSVASANVDGLVVQIEKKPGIKVSKGEVIARIRDRANVIHSVLCNADGILLSVNFSEGEYVKAAQDFYIVGETSKKIILGELDEIDAQKIAAGQACTVQINDSVILDGNISYINKLGTERNNMIRFKLAGQIDDPAGVINLFGISVPVTVILAKAENVLTIEKKALIDRDNKHFVRIQQGSGNVDKEVSVGIEDGTFVQILSGLKENDQVVVTK